MSDKSSMPPVIKYKLRGRAEPIEVVFTDGEVWLTQRQIVDLYKLQLSTVNEHLKKITVDDGPYPASRYVRRFRRPGPDGKSYDTVHYRLEVVEQIGQRTRKADFPR